MHRLIYGFLLWTFFLIIVLATNDHNGPTLTRWRFILEPLSLVTMFLLIIIPVVATISFYKSEQ